MDSLVLQTTIGLIVVFAAFGVAVSALTELVSRYIGLRGEYLLRGLRTLVDGPSHFTLPFSQLLRGPAGPPKGGNNSSAPPARVAQLISHPLVAPSALAADPASRAGDRSLSNAERRNLPAYISGQTFAEALLDILDPDPTRPEEGLLSRLRTWARDQPSSDALAKALLPLLSTAKDDVQLLETKISRWYDDHMARVSGWYKRHVRWISLCIGLVLVLAFNLNAVRIAQTLYSDQALRASVVTEATQASSCGTKDPATCLGDLRATVGQLRALDLPVGWGNVPECANHTCSLPDRHGLGDINRNGFHDVLAVLLVVVGWALMVAALLPGARFWFGLLSRLGPLRSTGPKPAAQSA